MEARESDTVAESALLAAVDASWNDGVEMLKELVAIASLSLPGSDPAVLDHSAQTVAQRFRPLLEWDFFDVVTAAGGAPAVLARRDPSPGMPTVLLYAHHDVQPAGDPSAWTSPAFQPDIREGRLYGRGSADDGAGIVVIYRALQALNTVGGVHGGLGIVVCIEGEEESGSPTFSSLLGQYREVFASDLIVVADSDNPAPDRPALTTSLRGVIGVRVRVDTLETSIHSGLFGGPTPDALTSLIRLLSSLHDAKGSVAIHGIDIPQVDTLQLDETVFRAEVGLLEGVSLWGEGSVASRLWWKPAVTITGIDAPATAEASNTLLAHASAKVSLRIPPGVSTEAAKAALESHLRAHADTGVRVSFDHWEEGEGYHQEPGHPLIALVEGALTEGYGNPVVHQGIGGSIPFVAALHHSQPFSPIAIIGVEDRLSAAHGPNESVDIAMLDRAARSLALILHRISGVLAD